MQNRNLATLALLTCAAVGLHAAPAAADMLNLDYRNGSTVSSNDGLNALAVPNDYGYYQLVPNSAPVNASDIFYDDYAFSVSEAAASSVTATIDLGSWYDIDSLQVRLFNLTSGYVYWSSGAAPAGVGSVNTATVENNGGSTIATLENINLTSGNYVLQISGESAGSYGGAYSGSMLLQPVPIPAAGFLLMSALLGMGVVARRK